MYTDRIIKIKELLKYRQNNLTVVMDSVHKPHNLGAIARTCEAVGIPKIHAVSKTEEIMLAQATAKSAYKWLDVDRHASISDCFSSLKKDGFNIYAADFSENAVSYLDIDFTKPTAIVMGAELDGISSESSKLADGVVYIPMRGMVESLNVSVAAAVMLFEAKRQRELKGMYDNLDQYSEQFIKDYIFEGISPKIAKYCKEKNIPYPEVDDDGIILDKFVNGQFKKG